MSRLAILAVGAVALLAWRRVSDRLDPHGYATTHSQATGHHPWWDRRCLPCLRSASAWDEPEDGVQPADPYLVHDVDPPYLEAVRIAIRRGAQSADVTTGGM